MIEGFRCVRCGNCCRPRGFVRLRENEAELIAGYQGMDVLKFIKDCTRITDDRTGLSLKERDDGSCIFLAEDNTCIINDVKPEQCSEFPHKWNYAGSERICKGIQKLQEGYI